VRAAAARRSEGNDPRVPWSLTNSESALQSEHRARPVNPRSSHSLAPSRSARQRAEQHTRTTATTATATGRDRPILSPPLAPRLAYGLDSPELPQAGTTATSRRRRRRLAAGRQCGFRLSPPVAQSFEARLVNKRSAAYLGLVCKM